MQLQPSHSAFTCIATAHNNITAAIIVEPVMHLAAGLATAAGNGKSAAAPSQDAAAAAQPATGYKQPPKEILDIVDAPPQPGLTFSPDRSKVCQLAGNCFLGLQHRVLLTNYYCKRSKDCGLLRLSMDCLLRAVC
jgi:hypothetical protein